MLFGYACHCTTLGGEFNKICGEWAGYACDEIEQQSPGALRWRLSAAGPTPIPSRGATSTTPNSTGRPPAEVNRLVKSTLPPLPGRIEGRFRRIELPLEPLPGRAKLEEQTKQPGAEGSWPGP